MFLKENWKDLCQKRPLQPVIVCKKDLEVAILAQPGPRLSHSPSLQFPAIPVLEFLLLAATPTHTISSSPHISAHSTAAFHCSLLSFIPSPPTSNSFQSLVSHHHHHHQYHLVQATTSQFFPCCNYNHLQVRFNTRLVSALIS